MSKQWPKVKLGKVASDLTQARTFNVQPDDVIVDPTIKSATHQISTAATSRGFEVKVNKRIQIKPGDLVFSRLHTQNGAFAFSDGNYQATGTFVPLAINEEKANRRFLFWALHQLVPSLSASDTVGRETYKTDDILALEIPLPTLAEQQRMVARIEELAAQIHEARTLRHQAAEESKALPQAAVEELCFGENFPVVPFGELLESAANGLYKPRHFWGKGIPCLRMYNIEGPSINQNNLQLLDVSTAEAEKYGCVPGDLIFNRVNSAELVGKTGILPDGFPACTFEAMNMRLRVNRDSLLPQYAAHVLNAPTTKAFYRLKLKQQCGMASIHQGFVRSIPTPRPPLAEQRRIVAELDALQAEVDALKRLQAETAAELDALLPAILDRAFKGEL